MRIERTSGAAGAAAIVNQPLQVGDRVRTGDGRAELELADASIVWIDRDSVVDLRALADPDDRIDPSDVVALVEGSVQIEASEPDGSDVVMRIDSAAASVYLLSAGFFRVEVGRGLTSLVSVGGLAEFSGEDGSVLVRSGQRSVVPEGSAPTEPRRQNLARNDPFDAWVRARADLHTVSTGGMSRSDLPERIEPYLAELALYGTWQKMPSIGPVWRPHQAAGWAPFLRGRWAAIPSGWFWISDEPWGWAPYRFGRWEQRLGLGWIWIPGSVWAGAWTGFAVGPTHIGWCPLNFYNQVAFTTGAVPAGGSIGAARLDPRAWVFVPIDRFTRPVNPQGSPRIDRLPRMNEITLTRRLPGFDPTRLAVTPGGTDRLIAEARRLGADIAAARSGTAPVPFRTEEQLARAATGTPGAARRRGAVAITRTTPPPAHPPRTSAANAEEGRQGHAVERLVAGTHPEPPSNGVSQPAGEKASPPASLPPRRSPRGSGAPAGASSPRPPIPPPDDAPSTDSER